VPLAVDANQGIGCDVDIMSPAPGRCRSPAAPNEHTSAILHAVMSVSRAISRGFAGTCLVIVLGGWSAPAWAQTVEVSPFAGFRLGDEPYFTPEGESDVATGPSFGGTVDVFFEPGRSVTMLFSHRDDLVSGVSPSDGPARVRVSFDHYLAGATDEYGSGQGRPFLQGLLGVTYLHGGGEGEARFTIAGGGGIKWRPTPHVGARLDGRVYAIFVGGEGTGGFCTPGICLFGLDVTVLWQAEFTAGVVLAF